MRTLKAFAGSTCTYHPRAVCRRTCVVKATADSAATEPRSEAPVPAKLELRNAGPEPKRFTVADGQLGEVASASLPALLRLGSGGLCLGYSVSLVDDDGKYTLAKVGDRKVAETSQIATLKRPAQPLELYEFEGCPFCKKVREAICTLDLDVMVYPCPKDGVTWRPKAISLGGKKQFPFLVDPNTGKQMYESDDIIAYLFQEYGNGAEVPLPLRLGALTTISCALGAAPRAGRGNTYRPSRQPAQPLVFWGYEMSPFVKLARETLSELELPYLYRTAARGSPKRQELLDKRGTFQVPYLEDPNEGVYLFESSAIVQYLNDTYGVKA
ncbi:hypothetical protein PLESTB_001745000 [Pleodorina starrii]|uniref:GST N-terminal domain-containing protein n=1 Tax=Pleodorina starrii TaxID=330485 RepID=A0A9W6BZW3_9CHLO|nr:hypothetical protein PLESTM_001674300 [Pleodorina starrii]GLC61337.1 hypothetical protein PLESTB_001745000 [Pleodorina starrii]GLC69352.1 hypothetical protein PLESTF_000819900 [Pleodorina starrii]